MKTTRLWEGYISGTNRGSALVRVKQNGNNLKAKAILDEQGFGSSLLHFTGILHDNHGEFRLVRSRSIIPFVPLDGEIKIDFQEDTHTATGTWRTDIGTWGSVNLRLKSGWGTNWWLRLAVSHLRVFWNKYAPSVYMTFLLIIVILDLLRIIQVSYPNLILLLIPTPFIFRTNLSKLIELIQEARVKKIGPIEFEQNPMTEDIRQVITQQVREAVAFVALDEFFVLRTKLLCIWLDQNNIVDRSQFNAYSTTIGVPLDNIDVTWNALIVSGCARLEAGTGKLTIMDLGRRYVAHLIEQVKPS